MPPRVPPQPPPQPPQTGSISPQAMQMMRRIGFSALVIYLVFWYFPNFVDFYFGGGLAKEEQMHLSQKIDVSGPVKLINKLGFEALVAEAHNPINGTGRAVVKMSSDSDVMQREVVAVMRDTYTQPCKPKGSYSSVVLAGIMMYVTMDKEGKVIDCNVVGQGQRDLGIDISEPVYFTSYALSQLAIEFRVYSSEYVILEGTPTERSAMAQEYFNELRGKCPR